MPEILGKDIRTLRFTREAVNEDGTIDISFSSETDQVERWFGIEVLSHAPGAMDMSRAAEGLPFLMDHCSQLIGRVNNIHIGADRKGRGTVRFSSSPEAQQIRQDMIDGIRPDISVGYMRLEQVTQAGEGNASDVVTVTRWMPFEISTVCVPADASVGVGRALPENATPAASAAISEEVRMDPNTPPVAATPAAPTINVEEVRSQAAKSAGERASQILALADQFQIPAEKRNAWIVGGTAVDAVRAEILEGIRSKATPTPAPTQTIDPEAREMKEYSILRAMRCIANGESGPELEISKTLARSIGKDTDGFYMPTNVGARSGLDSTTATKGNELKFVTPGSFLDLLRNRAMVLKMGATFLPGLQGNLGYVDLQHDMHAALQV